VLLVSGQGDSGGPLIIQRGKSWRRVQVGMTSWGISPCTGLQPGVYSRVSFHYEWLRDIICEESQYPPPYLNCFAERSPTSLHPTGGPIFPTTAPFKVADIILLWKLKMGEDPITFGYLVEKLGLFEDNRIVDEKAPGAYVIAKQAASEQTHLSGGALHRIMFRGGFDCCTVPTFFYAAFLGLERMVVAEGNSEFVPIIYYTFLTTVAEEVSAASRRVMELVLQFDDSPPSFNWIILQGKVAKRRIPKARSLQFCSSCFWTKKKLFCRQCQSKL
jgi:hypothetical protein